MDERFIGERITQLRQDYHVSEYQMSLELGQSKSYVQSITSGKSLPSVKQLFNIADYFGISLAEFFQESRDESLVFLKAVNELRRLSDEDITLLMGVARRISELTDGREDTTVQEKQPLK